jgi:hypothetical protein
MKYEKGLFSFENRTVLYLEPKLATVSIYAPAFVRRLNFTFLRHAYRETKTEIEIKR